MNLIKTLLFVVGAVVVVTAAPKGGSTKGKRSAQMPDMPPGIPSPPMPPGIPGMLQPDMAEILTRFVRQAPPPPPEAPKRVERQAPPPPPDAPKRVERQASPPWEDHQRVARQAFDAEAEKPKHLRQETLFSSVTTLSRKRRGSAVNEVNA